MPNARLPAFDAEAYRRDPRPYLAEAIQARQHQAADPDSGADPLLTTAGAGGDEVILHPGGADLRVCAAPGWPVTYVSQDRGVFENGLITITVQAGADGVAHARITAPDGTTDAVRVIAVSPVHQGNVRFTCIVPRNP